MLTRVGTPQLLVATSFLVAGGLVMVYSASAPEMISISSLVIWA